MNSASLGPNLACLWVIFNERHTELCTLWVPIQGTDFCMGVPPIGRAFMGVDNGPMWGIGPRFETKSGGVSNKHKNCTIRAKNIKLVLNLVKN